MRWMALVLVATLANADVSVAPKPTQSRPIGYIVPSAKAGAFFGNPGATFWTPTQKDVDELESRLPSYLGRIPTGQRLSRPLGGYLRQYVGVVRNHQRMIWVNVYFPEEEGCTRKTIKHPCQVDDGGDAYWSITYDPRSGEFSDFSANGKG